MRRERGLAVIPALLIVAIAAAAAALMLSQQAAMLDQSAMVVARAQADAYAQAGMDWARGVLAVDRREVDSLNEPWAQPIAALPVERAIVSGSIADEQGKFNLNNLQAGGDTDKRIFKALLGAVGLSPDLSEAVTNWVKTGETPDNAYYLGLPRPYRAANQPMVAVEELYRVRGFDAAAVAKLRPYVTALPASPTPINVNTASEVVLAALLGNKRDVIRGIVDMRVKRPFGKALDFVTFTKMESGDAPSIDVKSGYFSVHIQVAQDDVQLASDALVQRANSGPPAIIWRRPRY